LSLCSCQGAGGVGLSWLSERERRTRSMPSCETMLLGGSPRVARPRPPLAPVSAQVMRMLPL